MFVLKQGVHADPETIIQWVYKMFRMAKEGLPENLQEYAKDFNSQIREPLSTVRVADFKHAKSEFENAIKELTQEGQIEIIEPFSELRLADHTQWIFYGKDEDPFFSASDLTAQPLQFVRSRVKNFCELHSLNEKETDEVIISVTEAAENAIKYSNRYVIVFHQKIQNGEYEIQAYNSVQEVDLQNEIERGKFSEEESLMRGILVMSRLLDNLDLERDMEKRRVEFIGTKKLTGLSAEPV